MTLINATYICSSNWEIDFQLDENVDWYIRWDILYVKRLGEADYTEYHPAYNALQALEEQTIKQPKWIYVDDVLVNRDR
jgi:hypothetical protein